jgi:molecular chaperone GrpE
MTEQKDQNEELDAEVQTEDGESVEDFIKALEAKEKDLDISSELVIEVEKADFDDMNIPDFILDELKNNSGKTDLAAAEPATARSDTRVADLQNEVDFLKNKLASLISERTDLKAKSLKQTNEYENFKKRMERERLDTFNKQLENLAIKMLPVLDNLHRALDFSSSISDEKQQELKLFFDGIILVNHQLIDIFATMGVYPIAAEGEEFDPQFHEAAAIVEDGSVPQNTVVEELIRGYRIGNRVIRHSMVKVSKSSRSSTLATEFGPAEEPLNENDEMAE